MQTVHEQELLSIEELAELHAHTGALISSGILNSHERSHIIQVRDRLDAAIRRQRLRQQDMARR
ncbi:MAG TPA: hypothetical protein VKU39_06950 [Streptosporangiaceae bacterium]|nr:hypothetical protein [Streptosporangiaceae bacterium]